MTYKPRNHKGFTLAEILIVVSIIVILGTILLVNLNPFAQILKGYDAHRKADLHEIKTALESYYADHDCYPRFPKVDAEGRPSYACNSNLLDPYLKSMPCDPNDQTPYTIYLTPENSTCPENFAIYAKSTSFYDSQANSVTLCPKTFVTNSPGMKNIDVIFGCSFQQVCYTWYGCMGGQCVPVTTDDVPSCAPAYCDSECSPVKNRDTGAILLDCSTKNSQGNYVRACINQ